MVSLAPLLLPVGVLGSFNSSQMQSPPVAFQGCLIDPGSLLSCHSRYTSLGGYARNER
jgi:hypothetical protein